MSFFGIPVQTMLKLLHNCTHLTCQQSNAQNSPSQTSTVHELWTSRYSSWIQKRQRNQRSNCQHPKQESSRKSLLLLYWLCQTFDSVDHNKLWKILKVMGIPDHLTCLLRNLYAGQEATVRTVHGTTDWFQIGKEVCQGCILSTCLFNLYAEYVMRNTGLDEAQAGIKIAGRNIDNLICRWHHPYGRCEEELKSLLMKWKRRVRKLA